MIATEHTPRQVKILELLKGLQLSPATLRWTLSLVLDSRDSAPPSTRGHPVVMQSRKMGIPVAARSMHLEAARLTELEDDPAVVAYFTENGAVPVVNPESSGGGKNRRHHPDIVVIYRSHVVLEVCKYTGDIKKEMRDPAKRWQWGRDENGKYLVPPLAVAIASQRVDVAVKVVTEEDVNRRLVDNLEYLQSYLAVEPSAEDRQLGKIVLEAVKARESLTVSTLIVACSGDVDAVLRAIARQNVYVDLRRHTVRDAAHTPVYSSKLVADLHAAVEANTKVPSHVIAPTTCLPLRVGTPLTIRGVAATVVFVARDMVRIRIVDGEAAGDETEIRRDEAEMSRAPTGDGEMLKALRAEVSDVLLRAGRRALAIGRGRAKYLIALAEQTGEPLGFDLFVEDGEECIVPVDPSGRTVARWRADARKMAQEQGCALAGLVPGFYKRGHRGDHFSPDLEKFVHSCFDTLLDKKSVPQAQTEQLRHEWIVAEMEREQIKGPTADFRISYPLYRKLRKRYGHRKIARAAEGLAAANALLPPAERLAYTTPKHGAYFMQRCHMDHSPLAVGQVCGMGIANDDGSPLFLDTCWLSVLVCAYTRTVLAFTVSFAAPSWKTVGTLLRICVQRHGRLPESLVLDNAPEFRCHAMAQFCQWSKMKRTYRVLEKPIGGSVVERLFGVVEGQIAANLPGSTRLRNRNFFHSQRMPPSEHARLSAEASTLMLQEHFYDAYDSKVHPALGSSPAQMRAASLATDGKRPEAKVRDVATLRVLTMMRPRNLAGVAKVQKNYGVQINGYRYWHDLFEAAENEGLSVPVRVDPDERWLAYALVVGPGGKREWVCARSVQLEEHDFLPEIARRFADEFAHNLALRRHVHHQHGRRAILNFLAQYRRLPDTLEELSKTLADSRVREILLGAPEQVAPEAIATVNLPDTPTTTGRAREPDPQPELRSTAPAIPGAPQVPIIADEVTLD